MAHGDVREEKWRGNRRMEWVASTLHSLSEHGVSSITTADAHTSAASSRLNWAPPPDPADLNGLVPLAEGQNLFSARVPSHFKRSLPTLNFGSVYFSMKSTEPEFLLGIRQVSCTTIKGKIYVLAIDNADIRVKVRKCKSPYAVLSPVVSHQ